MRKQFKDTVTELASHDERIIVILGDVSVYLFQDFKERYPDRFYNMGICENTMVSAGAGLSSLGFVPFVHTIAPFITERSFEQIKLDMCYNRFGGNIVSCGASFDYAWDGATHHAYTDLAILRLLPGMEVIQPGSIKELDILLRSQYGNGKPTYFRLSDHPHAIDLPVTFGQGVVVQDSGASLTVMTAGPLLGNVLEACRDLNVNLLYFHTIKPIDKELISRYKDTRIVVVHDAFGLKEAVCEVPGLDVTFHGMTDSFCASYGTLHEIRRELGLDPAGIRTFVSDRLHGKGTDAAL
jgi:transketolase